MSRICPWSSVDYQPPSSGSRSSPSFSIFSAFYIKITLLFLKVFQKLYSSWLKVQLSYFFCKIFVDSFAEEVNFFQERIVAFIPGFLKTRYFKINDISLDNFFDIFKLFLLTHLLWICYFLDLLSQGAFRFFDIFVHFLLKLTLSSDSGEIKLNHFFRAILTFKGNIGLLFKLERVAIGLFHGVVLWVIFLNDIFKIVFEMEKYQGVRSMPGSMFLMSEAILLTTLIRSIFLVIESKIIKLVVSNFDESVEKRSYFKSGSIMVNRFYLWRVLFILIILK